MKTWEALKAADEGKKIRRKCWADGVYSFKDEKARFGKPALWRTFGRNFGNVSLEYLGWDAIFADDWEIYEECNKCCCEEDGGFLEDKNIVWSAIITVAAIFGIVVIVVVGLMTSN